MAEDEAEFGQELKETRVGHGGAGRNHGLPLGEATPELRKQWIGELQKTGKYAGKSLKELIAERGDGQRTSADE
ncbi:MAG TPA: hypothetical protein VKY26_07795 [Actinomycetota bacterium]|nr:hypothetical protein [Actinomycetota bacterium]